MDTLTINRDTKGDTLNVWFEGPQKEHSCQETGDEMVLAKTLDRHMLK